MSQEFKSLNSLNVKEESKITAFHEDKDKITIRVTYGRFGMTYAQAVSVSESVFPLNVRV